MYRYSYVYTAFSANNTLYKNFTFPKNNKVIYFLINSEVMENFC